jgi:L-lactate utilization protein LutC
MNDPAGVMNAVRQALGRFRPMQSPPIPPAITDAVTRLVHSDKELPQLFATRAMGNKMGVEFLTAEVLHARLIDFIRSTNSQRLALPESVFLQKLGVPDALRAAGFEVQLWTEMTLDALYDFDCAVTDVYRAVAETGSLVMRSSPQHGRALSLVPAVHVAILDPVNFLPDLVDLFDLLTREPSGPGITIISGPSKTADIEMNLVTGVHGPGTVQAFIVQ